tara:strand:- start:1469 stop:3016 length:1548 start_codon:yes stop_codon:yes gene_type:complete
MNTNSIILKWLKRKVRAIPYFYDRGVLILGFLKANTLKKIILLFLLDNVSKFFRNRSDYFDVSKILKSIYEQYSIKADYLDIDLRKLDLGLYLAHNTFRREQKIDLLKSLLKVNLKDRSFHYQNIISLLDYTVNGFNESWLDSKNNELIVARENTPIIPNDGIILSVEWYKSLGHLCLLGYLGLAFPKKFYLPVVEGTQPANEALFQIVKVNFELINFTPISYYSLLISKPDCIHSVDSIRLSGRQNPVKYFVNKALSRLPDDRYKLPADKTLIKNILDREIAHKHTLYDKYVTIHVRGSSNEKPNDPKTPARNASISSYIDAIEFLILSGYNVIRIGDYMSESIPYIDGFIDLTQVNRDINNDILLMANARFHIGTSSGPLNVPPLFGVPVLLTNSVKPLEESWFPMSFTIAKRCINLITNEYMRYDLFLKSDIVNEEMRRDFDNNLFLKDNTSEEILLASKDMISLDNSIMNEDLELKYKQMSNLYIKYLDNIDLLELPPHMPLAPSFLNQII